jgi:hypothetical protein
MNVISHFDPFKSEEQCKYYRRSDVVKVSGRFGLFGVGI